MQTYEMKLRNSIVNFCIEEPMSFFWGMFFWDVDDFCLNHTLNFSMHVLVAFFMNLFKTISVLYICYILSPILSLKIKLHLDIHLYLFQLYVINHTNTHYILTLLLP